MKKSIIVMGLSALLLGSAACSHKGANVTEEEKQIADSLSIAMGHVMGAQVRSQMERQIAATGSSAINVDKVMRGMELAIYADTTDERSLLTGIQIGMTLMQQPVAAMERDGLPFNPDLVMKAFKEAFKDSVPGDQYWRDYQSLDRRAKEVVKQREITANGEAGVAFVDSVKQANPNVVTTPTGLSYVIEKQGEEVYATPADTVLVNYTGALIDGTVFDYHSTGEPAKFALSGVVKGFSEGLQLIGEGGEGVLYIPGNLGYGDAGNPRAKIGPNATLVFNVQVVKVIPAELPAEQ